jgi:NADH:ubiquinone oxidoreductase subunit E/NAD-dependent dihydropyrimidine dehydrogenase PreA subunit
MRIGVYVCHCGGNISEVVDVKKVAAFAGEQVDVALVRDYEHMCSEAGQKLVLDDIKEHNLDKIVIAACSPQFHEKTFRATLVKAGLNPYVLEIANIREQCSWPHFNYPDFATDKAKDLTNIAVAKSRLDEPLGAKTIPIGKRVLVVGGGIAGIQAALDLGDAGFEVHLVEKEPSIGGKMAQLSRTFPTEDCAACILSPKMADVPANPNITLHSYSEVEDISGYIGNFKVKIREKARHIDMDACTTCGECVIACPVQNHPQIQTPPKYSAHIEPDELERLAKITDRHAVNGGPPGTETLIQVLQDINLKYNYLPKFALQYTSEVLGVPLSLVYHVATFYTAFSLEPRGRHIIKVCMGTACHARGAPRVLDEFERVLGIPAGKTTPDQEFTLETVNCLGCCALGPVVMIDDEYLSVTPDKVAKVLESFQGVKEPV